MFLQWFQDVHPAGQAAVQGQQQHGQAGRDQQGLVAAWGLPASAGGPQDGDRDGHQACALAVERKSNQHLIWMGRMMGDAGECMWLVAGPPTAARPRGDSHVKKGRMQPSAIRARLRRPAPLTNLEMALWAEPELNLLQGKVNKKGDKVCINEYTSLLHPATFMLYITWHPAVGMEPMTPCHRSLHLLPSSLSSVRF